MSKTISGNQAFKKMLQTVFDLDQNETLGKVAGSYYLTPNTAESAIAQFHCLSSSSNDNSNSVSSIKGSTQGELLGVDLKLSSAPNAPITFSLVKSNEALANYIELDDKGTVQSKLFLSDIVTTEAVASNSFDIDSIEEPGDLKEVAISLLSNPNLGSKNWLLGQLTSNIPSGTIEMNGTIYQIVVSNNLNYANADATSALSLTLANCIRELAVSGSEPEGISLVVQRNGDNVQNLAVAVAGKKAAMTMDKHFKNKGDLIFILGQTKDSIEASEYLTSCHNIQSNSVPKLDVTKELKLKEVLKNTIDNELINAAHHCSRGGLFITLAEMGMKNDLGFDIVTDSEVREDAFLFGETPSRAIVTVNEDQEDEFIEFMMNSGVSFTLLGHVTKGKMVIDDMHFGFITEAKDLYENSVENSFTLN